MTTWDYRIIKVQAGGFQGGKVDDLALENELKTLGLEGWELVSSVTTNKAAGETRDVLLLFKRPE